ncbi:MAG TPA: sensor domain-containing diguanylate cyclase [Actinomycetes bacterium]|nr:sensor domain-containing diguanylate cyclase [Actinomycetes bacterium]
MTVGHQPRLGPARREHVATRLGALAEIARAAWAGSQKDLLHAAASSAGEALGAASVSISRWDADVGQLRVLLNQGQLGPQEVAEPIDEIYTEDISEHLSVRAEKLAGWSANVDDIQPDEIDLELLRSLDKHCAIGAPIPMDGLIWGELFVTRTADQPCFEVGDVDLALVVAAQIGAALATADHLDNVDRMAHTDPLTGIGNRRAVDESLDIAFSRHRSDGASVGLVVCDLNGLKRINDDQGHEAGDRALVRFATMLSAVAATLPGAMAVRLGGDEFCIVASGVSADDLVEAAHELCRMVLRSPLEGVSCGVASTEDDVGDVETAGRLFRLADAAQYRAKRSRATVPIVAGRGVPANVSAHPGAQAAIAAGERRMFRGRDLSDTARLLRAGMSALDDARAQGVEERLVLVAEQVAEQCNPLGWWISRADLDKGVVRTARHAIHRDPSRPGEEITSDVGNEYALSEFPQTAHALGGHVVSLQASDPDTDPAELAMLDGIGATTLLMAGITDPKGQGWLLEIVGDAMSAPMADYELSLRALMGLAAIEARPSR